MSGSEPAWPSVNAHVSAYEPVMLLMSTSHHEWLLHANTEVLILQSCISAIFVMWAASRYTRAHSDAHRRQAFLLTSFMF